MKIEVGEKIRITPMGFLGEHEKCSDLYKSVKDKEGTIVYVNREHRYFTVEYDFGGGRTIRESFKMIPKKALAKRGGKYA